MKQVCSKVYYDIFTGEVLAITPECQGSVIETTKENDMNVYPNLQNKNIDKVDFITLKYGTLSSLLNVNVKSYSVNIESHEIKLIYYTNEELQEMWNQQTNEMLLGARVSDISSYLLDQTGETISVIEDFIIQTELNKVMEGMI